MGLKLSKRKKLKRSELSPPAVYLTPHDLYITPVSSSIEDEFDEGENHYENIENIIDERRSRRDVRDSVISESSGVSSLPSERFSTDSRNGRQTIQRQLKDKKIERSYDYFSSKNVPDNMSITSEYARTQKNSRLRNKGARLKERPQRKKYTFTKSSPDLTEEDDEFIHNIYDCSENIKELQWTTQDPKENVPFMIEAFQALIEGSVRVMEIVPHISFIENIEQYRLIARRSPQEAMHQLITEIKESNEPGKWQAFMMALKSAGYKYIVNLLTGETEADHTLQKKLLRLFTPAIIKDMNPKEFVDHLLEKDVITEADKEEIRCEERNYGDIAASLMLLERVPKRVENWYEIFLEVLKTCGLGHLVEILKPDDSEVFTEFHKGSSAGFMPVKDDERRYDDNHPNQNENHDHKNEIEALIAEKERLIKDIREEKEKRQLRKEISALKKELEDIKNDTEIKDTHCGKESNEPEKVTRGTNTELLDSDENRNQPMNEGRNQPEETRKLLLYFESMKHDITKQFKEDIEALKEYTTNEIARNNLIPRPHSGDPYLHMKTPLPHKMRLKSSSDSGIGYTGFSAETYV